MAGISNELLKLANTIQELSTLVGNLPAISQYFDDIDHAVSEGNLSESERDEIAQDYKDSISEEVDRIVQKISVESDNIVKTSVIESNDKAKNITAVIQGTPVITPPPSTYQTENTSLLSSEQTLQQQLNTILTQINNVVGG